MEPNNKTKLITLLCLIITAVLLEGVLIWAITPHSENNHMAEGLEDLGCVPEEGDYNESEDAYVNMDATDANDESMLTIESPSPIDYGILSTRRLTEEDLSYLMKEELRIARNEIYARHGYIFKSNDLKEYFSNTSWYQPVFSDASQFDLNEYERYNVEFIKSHE